MLYRSVTFSSCSGDLRHAVVGRKFDGAEVIAISGDGDPISLIFESGATLPIPCGSIVTAQPSGLPEPAGPVARAARARPEPRAQKSTKVPPGALCGISFHEQFGKRTVYIGDSTTYESLRRADHFGRSVSYRSGERSGD